MRHRLVLSTATLLLTALLVAASAPLAAASAVVPLAGGGDIGSSVALPRGLVKGVLDQTARPDDVYHVDLAVGQVLSLTLYGPSGTDFAAVLYRPGATGVMNEVGFALSAADTPSGAGYPQRLTFVCGTAGRHYLDVATFFGSGAYSLDWSLAPAPIAMHRDAGGDRYATAVAISRTGWASGGTRDVVVATGADFADALAASGLAGSYDCPILLTPRTTIAGGLLNEIDRLRGSGTCDVMIVGSGSAVSTAVADGIRAHGGVTLERFAGADRYATAAAIGAEVRRHELASGRGWGGEAFVVAGTDFPDALAASPFAARRRMPVLLVRSSGVPQVTQEALGGLGITKAYVIGGTPTIPQPVMDDLDVGTKQRLKGDDRFMTACMLAEHAVAQRWVTGTVAGIATGRNFPDALGGGPLLARMNGVLLLSERDRLPSSTLPYIRAHASTLTGVRVLGSHSTVSDAVFGDFLNARSEGLPR